MNDQCIGLLEDSLDRENQKSNGVNNNVYFRLERIWKGRDVLNTNHNDGYWNQWFLTSVSEIRRMFDACSFHAPIKWIALLWRNRISFFPIRRVRWMHGWNLLRTALSAMGVGRGQEGLALPRILKFDIFLLSFLKKVVFAFSSGYNGIIPFCSRGQIILVIPLKILPTPMPSGSLTPTDSNSAAFDASEISGRSPSFIKTILVILCWFILFNSTKRRHQNYLFRKTLSQHFLSDAQTKWKFLVCGVACNNN